MFLLGSGGQQMYNDSKRSNQRGFTVIEMIVSLGIMLIVSGVILALVRDSMKVAASTFELTDAQENLRTAQEFINRDLLNAGDGLKTISTIRIPQPFVTTYLTLTPVTDPTTPGILNLGLISTDNNVPSGTAVPSASPATTVRAGTDRQTMLEIDNSFTAVALPTSPAAIDSAGSVITVPATYPNFSNFAVGEIYFLTSSTGGTFGTITGIDTTNKKLSFANGDTYGLNLTGNGGHINTISAGGTLATSLQRMKIIHYYVNSNGLLMRRVFGVKGAGFRESPVAEHIVNVQFNYSLVSTDASGNVVPSTAAVLTTSAQQTGVRQVEIKVTAETIHPLQNGSQQQLTTTTTTSVRNMQFRRALQP
jgi:prepilin-type N-terminal cleavage/methylation domain-containing protein